MITANGEKTAMEKNLSPRVSSVSSFFLNEPIKFDILFSCIVLDSTQFGSGTENYRFEKLENENTPRNNRFPYKYTEYIIDSIYYY